MIVALLEPSRILLDDPVRPSIPADCRISFWGTVYMHIDDDDRTVGAVLCAVQMDFIPTSEAQLFLPDFTPTPRISTYITALIAGPYYSVKDTFVGKKTVPLGIYCRKSLAEHLDPEDILLITKQGFAYFEKVFGLAYPFEKYDQIAVVDFNWGAMENIGAVTFLERLLVFRSKVTERMYLERANVILHEMAHMWFGDLVTMQWWDDIWLNESFAEWASYYTAEKATRFKNSWTVFNSERKNWAYRQDQLSSTHPIAVDMDDLEAVKNNFDGITYAKGASVLQQLVWHVGKENFLAGLRKYFSKHAWGNTKLHDLLVELEETSGRDLTPWVKTWLQTAGVNTFQTKVVGRSAAEFSSSSYAVTEFCNFITHKSS